MRYRAQKKFQLFLEVYDSRTGARLDSILEKPFWAERLSRAAVQSLYTCKSLYMWGAWVVPLLKELSLCFAYVYPGFHFGLCPHYTLGFEEVSCLRHSILPSPNQSHTITHIKNRIIHPFKIQRHTY